MSGRPKGSKNKKPYKRTHEGEARRVEALRVVKRAEKRNNPILKNIIENMWLIRELRAEGMTYARLADMFGTSYTTMRRWMAAYK